MKDNFQERSEFEAPNLNFLKVEKELRKAIAQIENTTDFLKNPRKTENLAFNYLISRLKVILLIENPQLTLEKLDVSEFTEYMSEEEVRNQIKSFLNRVARLEKEKPGTAHQEKERIENILAELMLDESLGYFKAGEYMNQVAEKEKEQKHNLRAEKFPQLGTALIQMGKEKS